MAKRTFSDLIKNSKELVLVDFYATWCGPCKAMAPMLEKLATAMNGEVKIIKVDVDKNREAAAKYSIRSVPTLILFKSGNPVWKESGVVPIAKLKEIIDKHK